MTVSDLRQHLPGNVRGDILAGIVVALALIPEAIAFSIIAGVDPQVGLYASFCIALVIAVAGGRPGMISAATGAMALLMVDLVRVHGLEYLLAVTILTGLLQVLAGIMKLDRLMRFVSRSVMTGFVNALAILIFMAQLPEFVGAGWQMYAMVAGGLAIIYLLPRVTTAIPSPLVCIVVLTAIALALGMSDLRTVGDLGELPATLPVFLIPNVPFTLETLMILLPYAIPLTIVGLLETQMTATIVDDLTDTKSNRPRESAGQGIANIVSGFFGGMAGCAMIGQSIINVKSGGRGRLSSLTAGLFLMFLLLVLGDLVSQIPMAALVAVMIMVSIGTFDWSSIKSLKTYPKSSSVVMVATVVVVVYTHDLAQGVAVGVLLSALFYAHKVSRVLRVSSAINDDGTVRRYTVHGQVFFASAETFGKSFDFREVLDKVEIDVTRTSFWDLSAVGALDKVVIKFRREGTEVEVIGLDQASATLVDRVGVHDKPDAMERMTVGH